MSAFGNISIGKRLGAGFALVLAMTLSIGGAGIWYLNTIGAATHTAMDMPLTKERLMAEWHTQTFGAIRRTAAIVKSSDPSLVAFFKEDGMMTSGRSTELIKKIEPLLANDQEKAQFRNVGDLRKAYTLAKDNAIKAKSASDSAEAERVLTQEFTPAAKAYEAALAELVDMQRVQVEGTAHAIDGAIDASERTIGVLCALALMLGAACSWLLARGIVQPIRHAVVLAEAVAAGDLTRHIESDAKDETGALLRALRNMNDSLVRIVGDVRGGTAAIHGAAGEIAAGNLDLSSRTEQQAGSLERTASSMAQLTDTVRQNADNARQANQLSITASSVASDGGAVVQQVIQTMGSINESSRKIVDIISVIDGIAFQTNILALNAAVEAARAGEQGRGFAVVAGEVRTLAQRSAAAAKEIKGLIVDSVGKVDTGAKLVDQAGATMQQVVSSIRRVTDIMAEIASATHEQTGGIEQVNTAIGQMDEATQQNAALVEESAAAAGSLQDQAGKLAQAVNLFKLDREAAPRAVALPLPGAAHG
jgi:methyl-accepting chemotaxis protein